MPEESMNIYKTARRAAGITQEAAAEQLGISVESVRAYYRFTITGWMIAALIALCFVVAFAAMFGYDKLVQLVEQAGWLKDGGGGHD